MFAPSMHGPSIARTALLVGFAFAADTVRADTPVRRPLPVPTRIETVTDAASGVSTLRAAVTDRVVVPAGLFFMGSDPLAIAGALASCELEPAGNACRSEAFSNEYPVHGVHLRAFQIARRETTVASYERCVGAGVCRPPWFAAGGKRFDVPTYPVTMVAWDDAVTYCNWSDGRLPTEAEWERAARGPNAREYPWGDVYDPFVVNAGRFSVVDPLDDRDGFLELAPVGSFVDGRTPDGIDDLAGNVEEWVNDLYGEYPIETVDDPKGPKTGDERVIRGGSFERGAAWQRSAMRGHDFPSARRIWRGFRCVWDVAG